MTPEEQYVTLRQLNRSRQRMQEDMDELRQRINDVNEELEKIGQRG